MSHPRPNPDAAPTADLLLAELGWMRELACRLVAASDREDLVQDVLARTLERPPRHGRGLRGWLALALRNRARDLSRTDRSRRRREDATASLKGGGTSEAADDVVVRARSQRSLVDAILALDEGTRRALLLRYFDGVEPAEIARREGLPASTVRSRLQRGLAQLRERLGGDERAEEWLPGVALLAAGSAPRASAPPAPAPRPWPALSGGRVAAGMLLLVGGALTVVALSRGGREGALTPAALNGGPPIDAASATLTPPPRDAAPSRRPREAADAPGGAATRGAPVPPVAEPRELAPAEATAALAVLEVRVTIDGEAASTGRVLARIPGGFLDGPADAAREDVTSAPIGPGGVALLEVPLSGAGVLAVDVGGPVLLQRQIRTTTEPHVVETVKLGTAVLDGTLLDASGRPAREAEVALGVRDGWNYGALSARARTDSSGRFTFEHLPAESFSLFVASRDDETPVRRAHGKLAEGERRSITIGAETPSLSVRGVLRSPRGVPCVGAPPYATGELLFRSEDDSGARLVATAPVDPDGRFTVTLPGGTYTVVARSAGALRGERLAGAVEIREETVELVLVLDGASLRGQVSRADVGGPWDPALWGPLALTLRGASGEVLGRAGVDAAGRFAFDGLRPGRYVLMPSSGTLQGSGEVTLPEGTGVLEHDLWLR